MKKVLVTGGHVTPALAVMNELKKRGWDIVYVARKHALEGDSAVSQEWLTVPKSGYLLREIISGRVQRRFTPFTLSSLLKICVGFVQAVHIVLSEKPDVIVSFGGYVAAPIVFIGWLLKIPIVTHEQTLSPGLSNKIIAKLAQKICVSWEETVHLFPKHKTILTGNPLRSEIFSVNKKEFTTLDKPLIYITGGNLGAHSINEAVLPIVETLVQDFCVIHQCGNSQEYKDVEKLTQKRNSLPEKIRHRYLPVTYIENEDIGWVFKHASVVVSRSGANIISELIALKLPALLIPLPWSGENEQEKNAQFLAQKNAARILHQKNMTPETLFSGIQKAYADRTHMKKALEGVQDVVRPDAASRITDVVESVV